MNQYTMLKKKQQEEFNAFPIHAAFGEAQIQKVCAELGLSTDPMSPQYYPKHVVGIGGGCFILKQDKNAYVSMCQRHAQELEQAIANDKTGNGFIYDMFLHELNNHEFGYTGDLTDTIAALGLSMQDLNEKPVLMKGLNRACKAIMAAI